MSNLTPVPFQLSDGETGIPLAFSKLSFTLTGTTTPAPVYVDAALSTGHPDPLRSDDAGVFPDVFLDPDVVYRLRMITEDGDFGTPLIDHDPINELPQALTAELIATALGYTAVDPDNAKFTSEARIDYTDPLAVLHGDSVGFRVRPEHIIDAGYTLTLDDAGKLFIHDDTSSPSVIIDTNVAVPFPIGTVIYFYVSNTGTLTFSRESGVELRKRNSATNQDVVVAQYGGGELVQIDTDKWVISGEGLT